MFGRAHWGGRQLALQKSLAQRSQDPSMAPTMSIARTRSALGFAFLPERRRLRVS